ncbi:unnamed protein product [Candida verbasci]|uniref:DNA-directed RNA polymerase subunit n=1 Tax=Candida verbasci TaxID=1227364 RepID=A0A9W4TSK8_9ASCO|nr:unnamed protein product [Candida verbasci]
MSKNGQDITTSVKKRKLAQKFLNSINSQGFSECFKKISTSLYILLSPAKLNDPMDGIKQQHLDPLLMTYYSKLRGIIVSYSNLRFSNSSSESYELGKIEGNTPFMFFWISVDFLIFRPQIGDILSGDVYLQSPSHIGLLIFDTFNCSIKRNSIPENWSFQYSEIDEVETDNNSNKNFGHWINENGIRVEGKLVFTIKSIYTTGKMISVEGTLIKPEEDPSAQPITSSKHKKFDDDDTEVRDIIINEEKDNILPTYVESDQENEDEAIVNKSDSDNEVESD